MPLESKLQSKIITFLVRDGWEVNKRIAMSHSGYPDIEGWRTGRQYIEVEVKSKGKRPCQLQLFVINEHVKKGFNSFWCDSFEMFIEKYNECTF